MDTPYQWTKQVASHWGGTRNGTIVHWPNGIKAKGEIRTQFHHVIDVAPTLLEAAGLPEPVSVNGVQQKPIEGVSMLYSFNDAQGGGTARDAVFRDVRQPRHLPQGLDRGDAAQDAVAADRREDAGVRRRCLGALRHEQGLEPGNDLSKQMPEKLHELQRLWLIEAMRYNVLPLDDDLAPALEPGHRRPAGADQGEYADRCSAAWAGCRKTPSSTSRTNPIRSPPRSMVPKAGAEGVIIAQGGNIGGWSLYAKDGKLKYCYNLRRRAALLRRVRGQAASRRPSGAHGVRL